MRDRIPLFAFGATLAAITAVSLTPPTSGPGAVTTPTVSNLLHVPAYALLGLTACWVLARPGSSPKLHLLAVLGLVAFAGGMIETLQPLVGRDASLGDMRHNLLGAALAWTGWQVGRTRLQVHRA